MPKVTVLLLSLTMLSGCGGTQWFSKPPPTLPQTAATKCREVEKLCQLPNDFACKEGEDAKGCLDRQAALVQACHTVNTVEYAKCALRHEALIDWAREVSNAKR